MDYSQGKIPLDPETAPNLKHDFIEFIHRYFSRHEIEIRTFSLRSLQNPQLVTQRRTLAERLVEPALSFKSLSRFAKLDLKIDADRYILKRWLKIAPQNPEVMAIVDRLREEQPQDLATLLME